MRRADTRRKNFKGIIIGQNLILINHRTVDNLFPIGYREQERETGEE